MEPGISDEEAQQQRAKLAIEMEELIWENYWYQVEVNWHQCQANQNNHNNNWPGHHEDNNSQFFGPVPAPALIPMGWPWFDNPAPMAVNQLPGGRVQQQAEQQQVAQQQGGRGRQRVRQQAEARQPAACQPIPHHHQQQQQQQQRQRPQQQSSAQQPAAQQPVRTRLEYPVHDCPWEDLMIPVRTDHLYDHLAEKHGYEKAAKEYTVGMKHIKRKNIAILLALFTRDTRKLAWSKARLLASEEAIRQADPSYVSRHGLGLTMDAYSIPEANACVGSKKGKEPLKAMLIAVRGEMAQEGRLYNQTGAAGSSWGQVFDDLVSTFHLARNVVDQRAEQYFLQLRVAMGDDMSQIVTPAQVELTHHLQLKAGASLPPE